MKIFELKVTFKNGVEKVFYLKPNPQAETIFALSNIINDYADTSYEFWGFIDVAGTDVNIRLKEVLFFKVKEIEAEEIEEHENPKVTINKCKECKGEVVLCDDNDCPKNKASNYDIPF